MNTASQIEKIIERLHPSSYPIKHSPSEGLDSLLIKKCFPTAQYAFAIIELQNSDLSLAVSSARSQVKELTKGAWLLHEVGLYLLIHGDEELWKANHNQVRPDRSGLHAVIIQGIHFIDFSTGASEVKQSRWGACKFGDLSLPIALSPGKQ